MCFADSSVNVELEPDEMEIAQYRCMECKTNFKGLGKRIKCPSCESANVNKV